MTPQPERVWRLRKWIESVLVVAMVKLPSYEKRWWGVENTERSGAVPVVATLGNHLMSNYVPEGIETCAKMVKTGPIDPLPHRAEVAKPGQRRWV